MPTLSHLVFVSISLFFFNAPSPTAIYTLSLHDALPICAFLKCARGCPKCVKGHRRRLPRSTPEFVDQAKGVHGRSEEHTSDSSHRTISYAVFCLKKKKNAITRNAPDRKHSIRTNNASD